ncbi:hypothetical protein PoB_002188700 [Plakobranchus ocellatus]|uniref:Uncharacterized protein n=1 Tax=Plakobranchus ocellatus TaxID=259542 RepID=A0AAV3ZL81_9GAST|nr:hypothetical protein PoB_002188700 [Plakobranchus ocellatus]
MINHSLDRRKRGALLFRMYRWLPGESDHSFDKLQSGRGSHNGSTCSNIAFHQFLHIQVSKKLGISIDTPLRNLMKIINGCRPGITLIRHSSST